MPKLQFISARYVKKYTDATAIFRILPLKSRQPLAGTSHSQIEGMDIYYTLAKRRCLIIPRKVVTLNL